jgi:protoporphyrinogen oxidase
MSESRSPQRIAIIGAGMTGLSCALELAKKSDCKITIFEKDETLGGLSSAYSWQDVSWDKYYHVVLSTDRPLQEFLTEIGVADKLFWRETKTGFYGEGKLVSFSSTWDFIRFPFISLWGKFRLGLGILRSSRISDPAKLDKIFVREWLTTMFGRRLYEQLWDPLLRSKLGAARERTSAAFIWATINRLFGARESGAQKEKMGHVRGGYRTILAAAEVTLKGLGVELITQAKVVAVDSTDNGAVSVSYRKSAESNKLDEQSAEVYEEIFDEVIFTTPCQTILDALQTHISSNPHSYWDNLAAVEYLAIACVFLVLRRPLSPYYVTNLLDQRLPFTGVIEATNIVAPAEVGGKHIVYLPKYMPGDDPALQWSDDKILEEFVGAVKLMHPDLSEQDILHRRVFRELYVQPLQEVNYLQRLGGFITPMPHMYVVNTSMIYNSTLNNNAAVNLGKQCAREVAGATSDRTSQRNSN